MILIPDNASISLLAKLHPFVVANKPQTQSVIYELTGKQKTDERRWAKLAGERRFPASSEDDKLMPLIKRQHQMNRSWMHIRTDLPSDYYTSNPLFVK